MKEKLKEIWKKYWIVFVIVGIVVLSVLSAIILAPSVEEAGNTSGDFYQTMISFSNWFMPILPGLAGIALIKYILIDWK